MKLGFLSPDGVLVRALMDDADGLALLDRAGRIMRGNDAAARLLGAEAGDVAWRHLAPDVADGLARALAAAEAFEGVDSAMRLRLQPLTKASRGVVALLRAVDLSAAEALRGQLGQAQRLRSVGQLAGGIAHDFNNLLTAILGCAEDLAGRAEAPADLEDISQIRGCATRGAALIKQLLAFSRQQTLQPRVLALNDAVRGVAELLQRLLGRDMHLEMELEEPGRSVCIDPSQLEQVLMNLAVNARDAMAPGGRFRVRTGHALLLAPKILGSETVPPGRYATLTLRDTGGGIPPEILPHIFEPFFTTKGSKGTGLGLATVHGIVRQSGGFMAVESEAGVGTCFSIFLPRHEVPEAWRAPAPVAVPEKTAAPPGEGTILLVEDEAPVRRLAERALAKNGWRVVSAASAEEALDIVDLPRLTCVVSDVVMPGMDGPALVNTLRRQRPRLPAILVSGYAEADLRGELARADICFLNKPFAMRELVGAVADLTRAGAPA